MGPQEEAAAGIFPSMDERRKHAAGVFETHVRAYAEFLRMNPEIVLTRSFRRAMYIQWYGQVQQNLAGVRAPDLRAVQRGLWPLHAGPRLAEDVLEVPSPLPWVAAERRGSGGVDGPVLDSNWYALGFLSTALYNHALRTHILHAVREAHTLTKRAGAQLSHAILLTPPTIHLPELDPYVTPPRRTRRKGIPDLRLWLHVAASRWVRTALQRLGASQQQQQQQQQTFQGVPLRFTPADVRIEVIRVPTFLNNVNRAVSGVLAPMSDLIIRGPSDLVAAAAQGATFSPSQLPVVLFDPPSVVLFAEADREQPFRFTAGMPAHGLVPDQPMQVLTLQNVRLASAGNATAAFSAMASTAVILAGVRQDPRVRLILSLVFYGGTSLSSMLQDPPTVTTPIPQMHTVMVPSSPSSSSSPPPREGRSGTQPVRVFRWTAQVMPTIGWTANMTLQLQQLGMQDVRSVESGDSRSASTTTTTTTMATARLTGDYDDDTGVRYEVSGDDDDDDDDDRGQIV